MRSALRGCPPSACGRRVAGHFSALTQTNGSTNLKRQRADTNQGKLGQMLPDQSAVYSPEELSLLGRVLDQVVQSLPPDLRTPYNRTALAINILSCAAAGERDPRELRRAALNSKLDVAA
jgi:hypothetical protein